MYLCVLTQGMCYAFIGPCLHDLQVQTNSTLAQISLLFVGHAAGSVVGSVVSIYVVSSGGVVAMSLITLAASLAVVPWSSSLITLLVAFSVQGLTSLVIANSK